MGKTTPWVIGTVFGALVIAAVAWFFGIMPRLENAAIAQAETESERARYDTLEIQTAALRADFENIDSFRAELTALRVEVPTDELMPALIRELQAHAVAAGVVISNAISEVPSSITIVSEEMVEPEEGSGETEATVQTVTNASSFLVVPVRIRTIGDFPQTLDFLNRIQTQNPRLILVSDLMVTALDEAVAEGGLPAILDGWLDTEHTLFVIVLPEAEAVAPEPGPVPVPAPDATNPFLRMTTSGNPVTATPDGVVVPTTPDTPEGEETEDGTTEDGGEADTEG